MTARIDLFPTLDHCIETTARQEFSRSVRAYMDREEKSEELEAKIELLRMFLETTDFRELRRESERYLTEGKTVRFVLYMEDGKPNYEMKVDR